MTAAVEADIEAWLQGEIEVAQSPGIHVAMELLSEDDARRQIEARYEVGEPCPYQPQSRHARLLTQEDNHG